MGGGGGLVTHAAFSRKSKNIAQGLVGEPTTLVMLFLGSGNLGSPAAATALAAVAGTRIQIQITG